MNIEHIAVWSKNIEVLKDFYVKYFEASAGKKYYNFEKEFQSYFLSFQSGARLELMQIPNLILNINPGKQSAGFAHLSISVGNKEKVNSITELLISEGFCVIELPRYTGDGYYESKILDPDGNQIEITI